MAARSLKLHLLGLAFESHWRWEETEAASAEKMKLGTSDSKAGKRAEGHSGWRAVRQRWLLGGSLSGRIFCLHGAQESRTKMCFLEWLHSPGGQESRGRAFVPPLPYKRVLKASHWPPGMENTPRLSCAVALWSLQTAFPSLSPARPLLQVKAPFLGRSLLPVSPRLCIPWLECSPFPLLALDQKLLDD